LEDEKSNNHTNSLKTGNISGRYQKIYDFPHLESILKLNTIERALQELSNGWSCLCFGIFLQIALPFTFALFQLMGYASYNVCVQPTEFA
jgi:hypothetical protein